MMMLACDACRMAEQKQKIDWEEREKELIEVCNKYRSTDGSYDCLIPGSGGKDSFYQAHVLKIQIWNASINCYMGSKHVY